MKLAFKKDKYSNARGGYSRRFDLCCRKCKKFVLAYQKDGSSALLRLYFDRIFLPKKISSLIKKVSHTSYLHCSKCGELLGVAYTYKKENRKSFRLFQDAVIKKVVKLN